MNSNRLKISFNCHSELVSESVGSCFFDEAVFSSKCTYSNSFKEIQVFAERYVKIDPSKRFLIISAFFASQILKQVQDDKNLLPIRSSLKRNQPSLLTIEEKPVKPVIIE